MLKGYVTNCAVTQLSVIWRGVSTERFENIRYYIRKLNIKYLYMLIEFDTFQKHSTD